MTDRYENIRRALEMFESDDVYKRALGHATLRDQCHPDTIRGLLAERDVMKEALEMIAGIRPCVDVLMGNADIARAALEEAREVLSGEVKLG